MKLRLALAFAAACAALPSAGAPIALPEGRWQITVETVLPHLEEALRYATTRERRCIGRLSDVDALFPVLRHEALAGCTLQPAGGDGGSAPTYGLVCANQQAASGGARFEIEAQVFRASLELKMGGKNMTLSQRLSATRDGPCAAP